jgi:hypothetical protein
MCAVKKRRCRAAKKKVCNHPKKQTVNGYLEKGMPGAQGDVVGEPRDQQPAGPVAAAEHKRSADYRQDPD